jgi:hypothetical protein
MLGRDSQARSANADPNDSRDIEYGIPHAEEMRPLLTEDPCFRNSYVSRKNSVVSDETLESGFIRGRQGSDEHQSALAWLLTLSFSCADFGVQTHSFKPSCLSSPF